MRLAGNGRAFCFLFRFVGNFGIRPAVLNPPRGMSAFMMAGKSLRVCIQFTHNYKKTHQPAVVIDHVVWLKLGLYA
jgi:hypothetical protein